MSLVNTILSATVIDNGHVWLKKTEKHGYSLLGGHVEWNNGFPRALQRAVYHDHGAIIRPRHINGVYQVRLDYNGQVHWLTNINVFASIEGFCGDPRTPLEKVPISDLLSGSLEVRTRDTIQAAINVHNNQKIDLARVHAPINFEGYPAPTALCYLGEEEAETAVGDQNEKTVTGVVIESEKNRYLLMQCARGGPQSAGKWSLIGGKIDVNEPLLEACKRELNEEVRVVRGKKIPILGIIGFHINAAGSHKYFTNIATYALATENHVDLNIDDRRDEILDMKWFTFDEISRMRDKNELRTNDTYSAIHDARVQFNTGGDQLLPMSVVKHLK